MPAIHPSTYDIVALSAVRRPPKFSIPRNFHQPAKTKLNYPPNPNALAAFLKQVLKCLPLHFEGSKLDSSGTWHGLKKPSKFN